VVKALVNELKKTVVIANKETASFYKLLGFSIVHGVSSPGEALRLINEYKSMADVGVVMIEESLMHELGLDHMSLNDKGLTPLITTIPDTKEFLTRNPSLYYKKHALRIIGYEVSI
jgi:vacuolar-type H+-ATPase subunit F/Vma7